MTNDIRIPAGQPTGGQFAAHQRPDADTTLTPTTYTITTAEGDTFEYPAADLDGALRAHFAAGRVTEHAGFPVAATDPANDGIPQVLVAHDSHHDAWSMAQVAEGLAGPVDELTFANEEQYRFDEDDYDARDLESIRQALTDSPGDGPTHVELVPSYDEESLLNIDVHLTENLMWNEMFTEAELDEHHGIVEAVYEEWFGTSHFEVTDGWENVHVTLSTDIDRSRACDSLILERAWGSYAKFRNETDPGTFGSPYIGNEIRRRIDAAKVEAIQERAHEDRIAVEGR